MECDSPESDLILRKLGALLGVDVDGDRGIDQVAAGGQHPVQAGNHGLVVAEDGDRKAAPAFAEPLTFHGEAEALVETDRVRHGADGGKVGIDRP